jgi:hypothetical protein
LSIGAADAGANATDLGAVALEDAIDVAGLRLVAIGDFAFDPDVGEAAGEDVLDAGGER